jgi:hypothetical protein
VLAESIDHEIGQGEVARAVPGLRGLEPDAGLGFLQRLADSDNFRVEVNV